jgi:putative transposase
VAHAANGRSTLEDRVALLQAWRIDCTWQSLNRAMRRRLREKLGRDPEPSAGIVDSQSAETTGVGGEARGFDGGKKSSERSRDGAAVDVAPPG